MKTPNTILSNRGFVNGCGEFVKAVRFGGVSHWLTHKSRDAFYVTEAMEISRWLRSGFTTANFHWPPRKDLWGNNGVSDLNVIK